MATITVTIPTITDYPKLGDTHTVFRQKADIAWNDLSNLIPKINQWSPQVNAVRDDVNTLRNETESLKNTTESIKNETGTFKNTTLDYKNTTFAYKEEAVSAANSIQGYVIPTDTTYGLSDLEVALNGLLTQIVAQQAQISIITEGA